VSAFDVVNKADYAEKTLAVLAMASTTKLVDPLNKAMKVTGKIQVYVGGWVVLLNESGSIVTSHPFNPEKVTFEQRHKEMWDRVYEQRISQQHRKTLERIFGTR
jgi:hypothetical protein